MVLPLPTIPIPFHSWVSFPCMVISAHLPEWTGYNRSLFSYLLVDLWVVYGYWLLQIKSAINIYVPVFASVQFSHSIVSNSLWPHGLQNARLPCPSLTPGAYWNSCPLHWWCHPTINPLSSLSPPTFNLSQHQGLFQRVSSSIRWPKYWSFSFSISPSN